MGDCSYADVQIGATQLSVDIYKFNEERAGCALMPIPSVCGNSINSTFQIPNTIWDTICQTQVLSRTSNLCFFDVALGQWNKMALPGQPWCSSFAGIGQPLYFDCCLHC